LLRELDGGAGHDCGRRDRRIGFRYTMRHDDPGNSVRKQGDLVRTTSQLIDAKTGPRAFSRTCARELGAAEAAGTDDIAK
jgi:hypothetical protein